MKKKALCFLLVLLLIACDKPKVETEFFLVGVVVGNGE